MPEPRETHAAIDARRNAQRGGGEREALAEVDAVTARFMRYVVVRPSGCWEWIGGRSEWGYGRFYFEGRRVQANRWAYERWVGPLGDRFALHRCDNPPCVNPEHLFAGDHSRNMLDAVSKGRHSMQVHPETSRVARINREKTHCLRGHPLVGDNLFPRSDGRRECLTCRRDRERARRAALAPSDPATDTGGESDG